MLNPASVAGHARPRSGRHRAVAFLRPVGRDEDHRRDRGAGRHRSSSLPPRSFVTPDFALPPHGLNFDPHLHFPADRAELERRMIEERMPAALAWARANRLDRLICGSADAPIGLVTVGKRARGYDARAAHAGPASTIRRSRSTRSAMTWPLETEGLRDFARGKRALLVVEEKRGFVEIADPRRAVPPARR